MIQPYDHQKTIINETVIKLRTHKSLLIQASTGFGKTILASFLIKYYTEKDKKVLFIVDSEDLVRQTSTSLIKIGIPNEKITSKTKKVKGFSNCYIAMERSLYNRLEFNPNFLGDIDIIFSDECHILVHEKLYSFFPESKIIGMTATPILMKRLTFFKCDICKQEYDEVTECCGGETLEWTKPHTMSSIYETIVVGNNIDWLIEHDYLCRDISIVKKVVDTSKLKTDKTGEYTNESQTKIFSDEKSINALVDDYMSLCKGKKTLLFTNSTKVNKLIVSKLIDSGANAKSYDSKNNKNKDRLEVLNWFENNRDSVLVNTGCFVKGLDITDIEVIIGYVSTNSLSKFIQYVGRGGRTTKKIFKDSFLHLDYGGNIERHGEWSDSTRDWERIFYQGIGKPKPKREVLESVQQCESCGILYPSSFPACSNCGTTPKPKKKRVQKGENYVLEPIRPMPPPSGNKIVEYARSRDEGVSFCFKVLASQIVDLFRFYSVTHETYTRSLETGELDSKIKKIVQPAYFSIIKSDLQGANRRLSRVINDIKTKIEKYYESTALRQ